MPKPTAATEFNDPIPPGAVRVSVQYGGETFIGDFPSSAIMSAAANLDALAKQAMDLGDEGITPDDAAAVARAGADSRSPTLVIVAGLWLFMNEPGQVRDGAPDLLNHLINRDGGAWIACVVDEAAGTWRFTLLSAHQGEAGRSKTVH